MLGIFFPRWFGLHSRHLDNLGVTSLQGPSWMKGAPVRLSVATEHFTKGLLNEEPATSNDITHWLLVQFFNAVISMRRKNLHNVVQKD